MIKFLAAVYRANPFRPHCTASRHTRLCQVIVPRTSLMCEGGIGGGGGGGGIG